VASAAKEESGRRARKLLNDFGLFRFYHTVPQTRPCQSVISRIANATKYAI
jgi:hypothetical protein